MDWREDLEHGLEWLAEANSVDVARSRGESCFGTPRDFPQRAALRQSECSWQAFRVEGAGLTGGCDMPVSEALIVFVVGSHFSATVHK